MAQWVYIYDDGEGIISIGLTSYVKKMISDIKGHGKKILYLCPFCTPFDAVAHKHLLDDLSLRSVTHLIKKHQEQTKIWLNVLKNK
jgi:hypothetical protein